MRASSNLIRILLNGGDNMLGRAVQLTFPVQSPNEALLRDSCTAEHYLDMCLHPTTSEEKVMSLEDIRRENKHGKYLWGDYQTLRLDPPPDLRLMNLETALTRSIDNSDIPWEKGINYHFHLDNFEGAMEGYQNACHQSKDHNGDEQSAGHERTTGNCNPSPICITLANNHIMDFGRQAFVEETLPYLNSYMHQHQELIQFAGAGTNIHDASKPAHWTLHSPFSDGNNEELQVYVIAAGSADSGVPHAWGATAEGAGVFWLPALDSMEAVHNAIKLLKLWMTEHNIDPASRKNTNSLVILSVHFGPNWAFRYRGDNQKFRREFAHECIDQCGVDVTYGHSSHHIRGIEKHNGKLIVYGAGDLINDYEGFSNPGEEKYFTYGALFLVDICKETKEVQQLTLIPTIMNRLQLKLLCPSSQPFIDIWDPLSKTNQRCSHLENASHLCRAVNDLTKLDAEQGQGLTLRVVKDRHHSGSEYLLVHP